MTNSLPKISCLIVTSDRPKLLRRSVHSFIKQIYPNKELVVVDNGVNSIRSILNEFNISDLTYEYIEPSTDIILGNLRNISFEKASGDILTCWDDDDWFYPERLGKQYKALEIDYGTCCLKGNLFHVDYAEYSENPYRGSLPHGSPSTIMHYHDSEIRYPSLPCEEDTLYI